jgi:hypothetical protein
MTGLANSNSHSTFASNRRTLYKPKAGFSKARLRLLTNPIIFGGVFHFAVLKSSFLHSYLTMVSSWISRTIRRRNKLRR